MSYDNINFKHPNMTVIDGYFYMFDYTSFNALIQKVDDGTVAFSYPLDMNLGSQVKSLEFDGVYFWSLQNGPQAGYDLSIKKWKIENYICKIQEEFELIGDISNKYDSEAFTVEHYSTSFSEDTPTNSLYIPLVDYYDFIPIGSKVMLGPNSNDEYEEVTITGSLGGDKLGLNFFTSYDYEVGDTITYTPYIWLFNNYNGVNTVGALYKFDASDGSFIGMTTDNEYKNIKACTFNTISSNVNIGTVDALLYVKSTNLKFINPNDLSVYCVMTMDNLRKNSSTVITIYDLAIFGNTIYRLQHEGTYYGTDNSWSTYNYQISPIRNFIDSITIDAYPAILPNNAVNVSEITAIVKDQYTGPIYYKPVSFTDTDPVGFITINPVYTWIDGVATTYYKAGVIVLTVNIEAIVTQYD